MSAALNDKVAARTMAAASYRAQKAGLKPSTEAFTKAKSMADYIDTNFDRYLTLAISQRRRK